MTTIAALPFLPDAVIFDMDGLMIDSERVSLACWSQAADEFGLGLDEAVFLRMVGLGDRDTHALLRAQGIEDSVIEAVAARCHDLYEARTQTGLPLRPGILELLELLKAHAVPRAVATTTRQPRANRCRPAAVFRCGDHQWRRGAAEAGAGYLPAGRAAAGPGAGTLPGAGRLTGRYACGAGGRHDRDPGA